MAIVLLARRRRRPAEKSASRRRQQTRSVSAAATMACAGDQARGSSRKCVFFSARNRHGGDSDGAEPRAASASSSGVAAAAARCSTLLGASASPCASRHDGCAALRKRQRGAAQTLSIAAACAPSIMKYRHPSVGVSWRRVNRHGGGGKLRLRETSGAPWRHGASKKRRRWRYKSSGIRKRKRRCRENLGGISGIKAHGVSSAAKWLIRHRRRRRITARRCWRGASKNGRSVA